MKPWQKLVVALTAVMAIAGLAAETDHCQEAWLEYGLSLPECPVGTVRQTAEVEVAGLRRGAEGSVRVSALAHYTVRDADDVRRARCRRSARSRSRSWTKGAATPIAARWRAEATARRGIIKLPEVPDGDYRLRATYETRLGDGELDVPIPLYTPARIHVITDRPLYEPGNVVRFRAVALRARDLAPLDQRPGTWVITDPDGEVMLGLARAGWYLVPCCPSNLSRTWASLGGYLYREAKSELTLQQYVTSAIQLDRARSTSTRVCRGTGRFV